MLNINKFDLAAESNAHTNRKGYLCFFFSCFVCVSFFSSFWFVNVFGWRNDRAQIFLVECNCTRIFLEFYLYVSKDSGFEFLYLAEAK